MKPSQFEPAVALVLHHEAGRRPDGSWDYWSNNPNDAGKETAWGWSQPMIRYFSLSPQEMGLNGFFDGCMKDFTWSQAQALYLRCYWQRYGFERIDEGHQRCASKLMDCMVNCWPYPSTLMAQRSCGLCSRPVDCDGQLGLRTCQAINECDPQAWINAFADEMERHYRDLVVKRPENEEFLEHNWVPRARWGKSVIT